MNPANSGRGMEFIATMRLRIYREVWSQSAILNCLRFS